MKKPIVYKDPEEVTPTTDDGLPHPPTVPLNPPGKP